MKSVPCGSEDEAKQTAENKVNTSTPEPSADQETTVEKENHLTGCSLTSQFSEDWDLALMEKLKSLNYVKYQDFKNSI